MNSPGRTAALSEPFSNPPPVLPHSLADWRPIAAPRLRPDSLFKDISAGGHSGPIVQMDAPTRAGVPELAPRERFRYERHVRHSRVRGTVVTAVQTELVPYRPGRASRNTEVCARMCSEIYEIASMAAPAAASP